MGFDQSPRQCSADVQYERVIASQIRRSTILKRRDRRRNVRGRSETFRDGWVCLACWKPNRAQDNRCFACKTPRDQQTTVKAGSLTEKVKPGSDLVGRLDAEVPLLALLTAWPMRIAGVAAIGLGSLGFVLTLLSRGEGQPAVFGMDAKMFVGLVMFGVVLLGALQVFLADGVRRHARWAYVLTILIGLAVGAGRLLDVTPSTPLLSGSSMAIYRGGAWL